MTFIPLFRIFRALAFSLASLSTFAMAQTPFNSGSNGSYGAINLPPNNSEVTIQTPPDGIFHCTTIAIGSGTAVNFIPNAGNTPVYLLATGDVSIQGDLRVNGKGLTGKRGGVGGPGGFAGGQGGPTPSDGHGPGGGKGGWYSTTGLPIGSSVAGGGGFGTVGTGDPTGGATYGNPLLIPLVGGSGGGGTNGSTVNEEGGGGGGGGAILVASNTRISISFSGSGGRILAQGGNGTGTQNYGSGGAVRLVAPIVEGEAQISVYGYTGGYGRIRIDALTNTITLRNDGPDRSPNHATFGANMVVFPTNLPEIRITQAAGTDIALTQVDPVFVLLPAGAPATQTVQVQVKNFGSVVPLVAVVTPEAGERTTFNFDVDNTAGGVATGSVQVQVPAGVSTRIDVWTR